MKKTLLILLCAMLILSSCGAETPGTEKDTTPEAAQTDVTETEETKEEFILPERNYEGKTFMFYSTESGEAASYLTRADLNGEAVNDAIYNTEIITEELYNTNIECTISSADNNAIMHETVQLVLAGDSAFHTSYGNSVTAASLQVQGAYQNLYDFDVFDFSKPWWPKYAVEALTIGNQMYLGTSMISHAGVTASSVIAMNKDLAKDYNITAPYEAVLDGSWTLDMLINLTKDVYNDTNGDGAKDAGDQYGYVATLWCDPFYVPFDVSFITKSDSAPYLTINTNIEKVQTITEKLYSFCYESNGAFFDFAPVQNFAAGNAIFGWASLNDAATVIRNADFDYALFPNPKFDEKQEDYYVYGQSFCYVIPNVDIDFDFVGCVIEALACYRYQEVLPAYTDITMKKKLADSPEDSQMMDIILAGRVEPFDRLFKDYHGLLNFASMLQAGDSNYTTFYEANKTAAQTKLDELNKFYEEHDS